MTCLIHVHLKLCNVIQLKCYMKMYTFPTPLQTLVSLLYRLTSRGEIKELSKQLSTTRRTLESRTNVKFSISLCKVMYLPRSPSFRYFHVSFFLDRITSGRQTGLFDIVMTNPIWFSAPHSMIALEQNRLSATISRFWFAYRWVSCFTTWTQAASPSSFSKLKLH